MQEITISNTSEVKRLKSYFISFHIPKSNNNNKANASVIQRQVIDDNNIDKLIGDQLIPLKYIAYRQRAYGKIHNHAS